MTVLDLRLEFIPPGQVNPVVGQPTDNPLLPSRASAVFFPHGFPDQFGDRTSFVVGDIFESFILNGFHQNLSTLGTGHPGPPV